MKTKSKGKSATPVKSRVVRTDPKSSAKSHPVIPPPSTLANVSHLQDALAPFKQACTERLQAIVGKIGVETINQDDLEFALMIETAGKTLSGIYTALVDAFKKQREAVLEGDKFAAGTVAITFPVTTRTNPKWTDEAKRLAKELADAKLALFNAQKALAQYVGETTESRMLVQPAPFNEKLFEAEIKAKYTPSVSTSVSLVRSQTA
jgi:hypothetical protein